MTELRFASDEEALQALANLTGNRVIISEPVLETVYDNMTREDALKNSTNALMYAKHVLKGKNVPSDIMRTIARDSYNSFNYAHHILDGKNVPEVIEDAIARDSMQAFVYATEVIKKRFEKGEPTLFKGNAFFKKEYLDWLKIHDPRGWARIKTAFVLIAEMSKKEALKSSDGALRYAMKVLKGPFPEGEDLIAEDAHNSFYYALEILKKPWPKGEDAISTYTHYSLKYAQYVLKGPFPKGEDAISRDGESSIIYSREVIRAPFPKGENAIATDGFFSFEYAADVLKRRFLKGEKEILRSRYKRDYFDWLKVNDPRGWTRIKEV
jgi:lambda repressor-like predicted transcriptional regulator